MADPLSVAGSVAGLVSLASYIYTSLDTFITNVQDAPSFAIWIRAEVDAFRNSLNALNALSSHWTVAPNRAALIPADFVVLTLTDATILFSEIEAEVLPLVQLGNLGLVARARWTRKKTQLESLISRLQWQKMTLALQLNILQCASENDAHKGLAALTQNCMQKLADNRDLERRLELVEAQLQQNIDGDATSISSSHSAKSDSTVRPVKSLLGAYPIHHEFEETLYASWVYRRNRTVRESMSFHSSVIRQSTWSMLSELSLGQISVISVIALPVQRSELSNAQWYGPNINKEEGYRENVSGGDTAQVSEIQLPEASTNQRVIPYFPPGYNGLGGPTDSHSLDTSELTGVNQEMQNDEFSDSDIIDMEMLLHNPWRDGHQGFSGGKHLGATNSSSGNRKTLNDYLSKSLKKSNIAVLRDNNGDWEGSIVSYTKACKLLKSAALIVPDSEDRAKLGSLHATYSLRISELETMCGHRPYRGGHNTEEREVNTLELIDLLVDADVMYP